MVRTWQAGAVTASAAVRVVTIFAMLVLFCSPAAQSQAFQVLYSFTGDEDGHYPVAGLTLDRAGNLYGATTSETGPGAVFRLQSTGSGWAVSNLYTFHVSDGASPAVRIVFGPDGTLYGTTVYGGTFDYGTVYNLRPPATACLNQPCPWIETVLYSFQGGEDGQLPTLVEPVFDGAGNLYGTTYAGGTVSVAGGVIFRLSPSHGSWTESVIHSFGGTDHPVGGVVIDADGNLYGTTTNGGNQALGYVFQLALPAGQLTDLYDFQGNDDGAVPIGGLLIDASSTLYGTTTTNRYSNGGGTVFALSPGSPWNFTLLAGLTGSGGPQGNLAMDAEGNLYGTTFGDGAYQFGSVFKLTRTPGGWIYSTLHDFTDGQDGGYPIGGPILDANGNLYGTATTGGRRDGNCPFYGCGVVWEILQ